MVLLSVSYEVRTPLVMPRKDLIQQDYWISVASVQDSQLPARSIAIWVYAVSRYAKSLNRFRIRVQPLLSLQCNLRGHPI